MRALKLPAQVTSDHTLHLCLPDDISEGVAEVIVLLPEADEQDSEMAEAASLEEFLAAPRVDRRFIRSKQELDDCLRAERESWE